MWKVAPALACGNAVILKPHERTPLSALFLGHIMKDKLPPGIMAIIPGGADVGRALTEHHSVDKISFTGSGTVGRHVMMAAAKSNFKRVTLELGGKSPAIVFDDAHLDRAVEDVYGAIFANMGQNCCAGSRLFLHESIHDAFLTKLKQRLQLVRIGDATNEAFDFGPIVDQQQFTKIMGSIQAAKDRGVRLLHGGRRHGTRGYFIEPTVFTGVADTDLLACEEIFGPVLAVMKPFKTEDEVIQRANATPFGLASGVWTHNLDRMHHVVERLRAGITWVNCYNQTHPSMPFGGVKESGFGYDLGEEAILQEYTVARSIYVDLKKKTFT
jgi:acyl-CoA reductase-like NAD-dependent aldehyde dehydrogenase